MTFESGSAPSCLANMLPTGMSACPDCGRHFQGGEVFCPFDGRKLSMPPPADSGDPLIGALLDGRYRIERELGRGGMGTVYGARMPNINKPVAVKVLRALHDDGGQAMARFEREARSASRLGEEHIVDVLDFGKTPDGTAFLVMEWLQGHDLGTVLENQEVVPIDRAARIFLQCTKALKAAHDAGIVHRDLKPENIFLTQRPTVGEFVKLVDFGLAKVNDTELGHVKGQKLTKTGMIFGTPQYMSPEQGLGKPADERADIYALGVILFEMLTGSVPFDGDNFMGVINQHLLDEPPPFAMVNAQANVPTPLEEFVRRLLAKDLNERPRSMVDAAREFDAALRQSGLSRVAEPLSSLTRSIVGRMPPAANRDIGFDDTIGAGPEMRQRILDAGPPSEAPAAIPLTRPVSGAEKRPSGSSVASVPPPAPVGQAKSALPISAAPPIALQSKSVSRSREDETESIPRAPKLELSEAPSSNGSSKLLLIGAVLLVLGAALTVAALFALG